jgi:peroxiredoxin
MVKQILFLLSLLLTNICFSQEKQDSSFVRINFDAVSTIKVHFRNFNDTILFVSGFGNFFPNDYIEHSPIKLFGDGIEYISLKIQMPQKVDISFTGFFSDSLIKDSEIVIPGKDLKATCFLVPFDTLEVDVDYSQRNPQKQTIKFIGKYALISDYYRNKEVQFNGNDFIYQKGMLSNMATNLDSFKNILDSITDVELKFLNDYLKTNDLPKWFVDYESADLKYFAFGLKLSEPMLMEFMNGTKIPIPNEYFSFANELPLNNESAILSIYYFLSLRDYFQDYFKPLQVTNKPDSSIKPNVLEDFVAYSITHFSPYISDVLLAIELDMRIGINRLTDAEYGLMINAIKNPDLKNYLEARYKHKETLKKGDNAPYFYLKNEINEYLSLNDFTDNVIYLSFWFTGCKPCIKEFPDENHLVDIFKNEKVKIISICMNSNEDEWKQLIMKHQLKTVNLFAKGNWENILKEKYDITIFPHHVLIDRKGKIIENKCTRPGQAEQEIRNNLNN